MTDSSSEERFVASFFTLSGAGFGEPPRHSFAERVQAAADAGYDGIGIHLRELRDPDWNPWGMSDPELVLKRMREVLKPTHLDVVEYEFLDGWVDGATQELLDDAALFRTAADMLATGSVGGYHISTGHFGGGEDPDPKEAVDGLTEASRVLASEPGGVPLSMAIEAFPWSRIFCYPLATEMLRWLELEDSMSNCGLLIDLWHFCNTSFDLADLKLGELGRVVAVQLNGGDVVHGDYLTQARSGRALPGHGSLPARDIIVALRDSGFQGPWCVESNTPELRKLPVEDLARVSLQAARATVRAALSPKGKPCPNPPES